MADGVGPTLPSPPPEGLADEKRSRRRWYWVGVVGALLFVGLVRVLLVVNEPEPTQPFDPTIPTFATFPTTGVVTIPESAGGTSPTSGDDDAVIARVLAPDELCALLRPGQLAEIYGGAFGDGESRVDVQADGRTGSVCTWEATSSDAAVRHVRVRSISPSGSGEAVEGYTVLRSAAEGADEVSEIADEAFFARTGSGGTSSDSITLRDGVVLLTVTASPAGTGGSDRTSVEEVARIAADNLPAS